MSILFKNIISLAKPKYDALAKKQEQYYFRDALATAINDQSLSPSQLQFAIFAHLPGWVKKLMTIRNKIVGILGFTVGTNNISPDNDDLNLGDKVGFLQVIEKSEDEIISYAEDKHITFYLSVAKANGYVVVSSLVNKKTLIGRIYVSLILPFHYIIARTVLNNAIKANRI